MEAQQQRGGVRPASVVGMLSTMRKGMVRWFNATKGSGFITPDNGNEYIFFHQSPLKSDGYCNLNVGDSVEFEVREDWDRRPRALNITPPGAGAHTGGFHPDGGNYGCAFACLGYDGGSSYEGGGSSGSYSCGDEVVSFLVSSGSAAHRVFDEMPHLAVVWDDELQHSSDSHDGLLKQLAEGVDYVVDEEFQNSLDLHDDLLQQEAWGRQCLDDELVKWDDDESAEVVISSLRLGDDQDGSLFTNSNWFTFDGERSINDRLVASVPSSSPNSETFLETEETNYGKVIDTEDQMETVYLGNGAIEEAKSTVELHINELRHVNGGLLLRDIESDVFGDISLVNEIAEKSEQIVFTLSVVWDKAVEELCEEIPCKNVVWGKDDDLPEPGADLEIRPRKQFDAEREVKRKAYEKSKNSPEGYPKGQILAFKLKKISGHCDTVQNGGDKIYDTDGADKEGASNATEKSSVGHKDKLLDNKKDMSEEKSDGAEELQGVDAGETTQSVGKDDKSLSDNNQDIMLREDIKEEFTKIGAVRYVIRTQNWFTIDKKVLGSALFFLMMVADGASRNDEHMGQLQMLWDPGGFHIFLVSVQQWKRGGYSLGECVEQLEWYNMAPFYLRIWDADIQHSRLQEAFHDSLLAHLQTTEQLQNVQRWVCSKCHDVAWGQATFRRGGNVTSGPLICGLVPQQPSPWPVPGFTKERQSTGEGIEEIRIGLSPSSAAFLTEEYGLGELFVRLARRRRPAMRSRPGGGSPAAMGHHSWYSELYRSLAWVRSDSVSWRRSSSVVVFGRHPWSRCCQRGGREW